MYRLTLLTTAFLIGIGSLAIAVAQEGFLSINGFQIVEPLVPASEIMHGGPARDGIPALDSPSFDTAKQADWLKPEDAILGMAMHGVARAYPIRILNWHEIVNDRFGENPVTISYCPLCGTGVAFTSRAGGKITTFGVSGLLYNSDMLLYDRQTESLWSQISGLAISGPLKGAMLERVAVTHTTWRDWRKRFPDTVVLSKETGHRRDYDRDPYAGYEHQTRLFFPVRHQDARLHPKERVIGIEIQGRYKAYPFVELGKKQSPLQDRFAGKQLTVRFDLANRTGEVVDEQAKPVTQMIGYWFAWYAFHPDTVIYMATQKEVE